MFENHLEYQNLLDTASRAQRYGLSHRFGVPQMVIVGEQSSGKSRTFTSLTQLPFPHGEGMCTRFAIMVNLRRNTSLQDDELSARIEGLDNFNRNHQSMALTDFQAVIEDAKIALHINDINPISEQVLEITVTGPQQIPLTIVDLPGFISNTGDNQDASLPEIIEEINSRYMEDCRTIILAIVPATVDLLTSRALSEAKKYDPKGVRTIPIVTKPDLLLPAQTRGWVDIIRNRGIKTMKLGYLVMCNGDDDSQSWAQATEQENRFFSSDPWSEIRGDRKGRVAVKTFLGNLLYEHMSKELPAFKQEVYAALNESRNDLEQMGTPIASPEDARRTISSELVMLQKDVTDFLNAEYDPTYIDKFKDEPAPSPREDARFARAALNNLYLDYRSAMMDTCRNVTRREILPLVARYKSIDLAGTTAPKIARNIINGHFLGDWRRITEKHIGQMQLFMSDALSGFIAYRPGSTASRDFFVLLLGQFYVLRKNKIEKTIRNIFQEESVIFTLNARYLEDLLKGRTRNNQIPALLRDLSVNDLSKGGIDAPLPPYGTPQRSHAGSPEPPQPSQSIGAQDPSQNQQNISWSDEHIAVELTPCLNAYVKTVCERIVDKVLMQTVERHLFMRITSYFLMLTKVGDEELLSNMMESPAESRKREDLKTKIEEFKSILNIS